MIIRHSLPYQRDSYALFSAIRPLGMPVWLDSNQPHAPQGRYDIISAAPVATLTFQQQQALIQETHAGDNADQPADGLTSITSDRQTTCPFQQLERLLKHYTPADANSSDLPFCGGAIGLFGYDLGRTLEKMPEQASNDMHYPDMQVGIYLWALIIDHQQQRTELVMQPTLSSAEQQLLIERCSQVQQPAPISPFRLQQPFSANVSESQYHQRLQKIDDYIHAGDCYQVNFAQRFSSAFSGDPLDAYLRLRQQAPTPFAAYLESSHGAVLSLSPERFLEVGNNQVSTKPIKGTRPTRSDPIANQAEIDDLLSSTKDRAENLMIVDLLRNDLSKACEFGSVRVPELFALESYANVHHLVSTVTGTLEKNNSPLGLLRSCFPGGSITGAPKLRAMEIIEELEPHRRSVYCGSIGYISFCGKMDTSITIRTLLAENEQLHCWAGGGIVADSSSDEEYQETFNKVNNLLQTLEATLPV
ncbi:MAG: aminodeoxychorismate synthase component I [Marinobacterium sp.]|nr:aminodeoxychorismate synthase component I [Marinobacterium sp.]